MTTKEIIRRLPNKNLINAINSIRKEKAHPKIYGKYGTSKFVTSSEFWSGHHGNLKRELERRKSLGKIKSNAGKSKKSKVGYSYRTGQGNFNYLNQINRLIGG